MEHLPNIKHKNTITPQDFVWRVNLYAAWIHLFNAAIQSIAGQWHRLAKSAQQLSGVWRIQADAKRAVDNIRQAKRHLEKYENCLDNVDIAEWLNVRDKVRDVHDAEQREINLFIRFFGLYYKDFYGKKDAQEKLWEFMEKYKSDEVSDAACDVFALNYIYTLNIENDDDKTGNQR